MTVLELEGVTKRYGPRAVVDALSFAVPEGTVYGLLGPNGAGKTTTIRVLLHLARADAGSVVLLDRRLGARDYHRSLRMVGSLVEGPALYRALSARRNLQVHARALGLDRAEARIDDVLGIVGLAGRDRDRVKKYSLGMKQRLGLAVALLPQPRLLILDEPTNGLDPAGIVEFRDLIRRLPAAGTTVLLSSHLLGEVQQSCDHVAIITHGRLVTQGRTADVVAGATASASRRYVVEVDPGDAGAAWQALGTGGVALAVIDERRIAVQGDAGLTGRQLTWLLASAGVYPEQVTRAEDSLEDVFLRLTGVPHAGGGVMG